jgi:hypothetical protein
VTTAFFLLLQITSAQAAPLTGEEVLARMHERWNGKWFKTMTFIQETRFPGRPVQIWYETIEAPGRLRIDFGPIDSMNTAIIKNDSVYQYRRGTLRGARPYPNTLGVVLSDVYAQPVSKTVDYLRRAGFDLGKVRTESWQGHPVWVIGAAAGDSTTPQLWIDQSRLVLDRIVEKMPNGATMLGEILGRETGAIPVENDLRFYENGVEVQREVYTQITLNPVIDPDVFDTGDWKKPSWVTK